MAIGGVQKNSYIDYPGLISCVLFLSGCNYACPYCHNPDLARGRPPAATLPTPGEFLDYLSERRSFLEGVVISGGEPTLERDLAGMCTDIRQLGYRVKLDTNGSRPLIVRRLIEEGLVDFVAMDIKTDPRRYTPHFHGQDQEQSILESIRIIMDAAPAYEFRTTCVKPFISEAVIETIGRCIEGAERFVLQGFQDQRLLNPEFFQGFEPAFKPEEMVRLKQVAEKWVGECVIR